MEPEPDDLVPIARVRTVRRAHELGLVILSAHQPYWVRRHEDGRYRLLVRAEAAPELVRQLKLYKRESINWPPRPPEVPERAATWFPAALWAAVLTVCYGSSLQWPRLYELGKLSAEAVFRGEVYRAFTALFLHADFGHLAGNAVFGGVFLFLLARHLGGLWAWLGTLAAGFGGNLLNAWLYHPGAHYSVGASTAVFGAVGLMAGLPVGFGLRHGGRRLYRAWVLPVVAGLVLLAWFGTGGEQTDTSAHLMGFACGLPLGLLAGWTRSPR